MRMRPRLALYWRATISLACQTVALKYYVRFSLCVRPKWRAEKHLKRRVRRTAVANSCLPWTFASLRALAHRSKRLTVKLEVVVNRACCAPG